MPLSWVPDEGSRSHAVASCAPGCAERGAGAGHGHVPITALEVTRELGALQAQDYASGGGSIGVRSGDRASAEIEQAVLPSRPVRLPCQPCSLSGINKSV